MPKKGKKGKGKGKGKKGKKGSKKAKKDANIKSMSLANSRLWESRLELTEKSRQEYRENARKLLLENESLHNQMHQTEKDTIDVVTYLKRQDQEKDQQVEKISLQLKEQKKQHRIEMEKMAEDFQKQLTEVEQKYSQKSHDVDVLQTEIKGLKEFRRKRAYMQKELEEIKETMFEANREHKDTLVKLDQKFFEEKMRLQQEANQRISELAERAHNEAIQNLDETTQGVYKENVRVNEALSYHMSEEDRLKENMNKLSAENKQFAEEHEMNNLIMKEKLSVCRSQKLKITELQEKILTLEKSLSHVVREFDVEKRALEEKAKILNESTTLEISKLKRMLELKTREMSKVKRLARNILDQRTEVERFFLESLAMVRKEIAANQQQYRRDAQMAFQTRMLDAHAGRGSYPRIRTFNRAHHSTNSVFHDLEAAERLMEAPGQVDVSDLTWEQRERLLRHLFAMMNGKQQAARDRSSELGSDTQSRRSAPPALPPGDDQSKSMLDGPDTTSILAPEDPGRFDETFITQREEGIEGTSLTKLPSIHPAAHFKKEILT